MGIYDDAKYDNDPTLDLSFKFYWLDKVKEYSDIALDRMETVQIHTNTEMRAILMENAKVHALLAQAAATAAQATS